LVARHDLTASLDSWQRSVTADNLGGVKLRFTFYHGRAELLGLFTSPQMKLMMQFRLLCSRTRGLESLLLHERNSPTVEATLVRWFAGVPGKSHRGALKRFQVSKDGAVRHAAAGRRHLLSGKSAGRHARLRKPRLLQGADARRILRLVGKG
jgi:large subunit ribosomal protein L35